MINLRVLLSLLALLCAPLLTPSIALAEQYPSRSVSILVPYPAGVPFDLLARALAERLRSKLGVAVIVENKPGANGLVATQAALQAKPDGHTFVLGSSSFATIPLITDKAGYAVSDFVAVAPLGQVSYMLCVGGKVPVKDIEALIPYLQANVGKLNAGVLAAGGLPHMLTRKLSAIAKADINDIRYRGSNDIAAAMLTGDVQLTFSAYNSVKPFLDDGKLRLIGVGSDERSRLVPDLPTFKEKGFTSLTGTGWLGLFTRAGTPDDVVKKARDAVYEILNDPTYQAALQNGGMDSWILPFEQLQAFIANDTQAWSNDVKDLKIDLQ